VILELLVRTPGRRLSGTVRFQVSAIGDDEKVTTHNSYSLARRGVPGTPQIRGTAGPWICLKLNKRSVLCARDKLGMPAKSKQQQMAAGAALAAKRGEKKKSSLKGASKQMAKSMSEKQLKDFAGTKRKSLPKKRRSG
jgi:hypothetical protein